MHPVDSDDTASPNWGVEIHLSGAVEIFGLQMLCRIEHYAINNGMERAEYFLIRKYDIPRGY